MATSDERREVAERLRWVASERAVDDGVFTIEVIEALKLDRGRFRGFITPDSTTRLADLIDPTCQNDGDEWGFLCSKCGELVSITKEVPCGCGEAPYIPYYCPSCGARVVNCHE